MARAPPTASGASAQKSIASMHPQLSLAVGYNSIVTHGRRSCNNVVAILARIRFPRCSEARCRTPAFILSLAALTGYPSWGAAFALPHPDKPCSYQDDQDRVSFGASRPTTLGRRSMETEEHLHVIGIGSEADWEAGRGSFYYIEDKNGEKCIPVFTSPERADRFAQANFD